jgi:hypothetical protein
MKLHRRHLGLVAVAAALAVPASGTTSSNGLPTSIGKGEGQLNLIEWPGYSLPAWRKPFEKASGCKIKVKDAGSSNEMVALMRAGGGGGGGQWDMVSASGDASLRLIYGGDVEPVNIKLIPDWKNFIPQLKSPSHNTVKGVHYGVSLQWGPNTLIYNTNLVKPAPKSWSVLYDPKYKGKISVPNNPIQIADAALYLMRSKPSLGIRSLTGTFAAWSVIVWYGHVAPSVESPFFIRSIWSVALAQYFLTSGRCSLSSATVASNCGFVSSYGSLIPSDGFERIRYSAASAIWIGLFGTLILPLYFGS